MDFSFDDDDQGSFNNRGFGGNRYADAYGDYRGGYRGPPPPRAPMGMGYGPEGPPSLFARGMRPPMPPPMFGRPFPPPGPPPKRSRPRDNPIIKYLKRCGVPKESLQGLPQDLLIKYQPQHCGLCGFSFNSMDLSRSHYVSKNHMKNQKKFLNLFNGQQHMYMNPKQAPLKARELYCELCDVQITSTVHAEAHYAGKSHKAVVLGRKVPKNPLLNQPGMERRVKQLIRREKRFIKDVPDEEKEPKESKPIVPELYCEICKTSMTCSEQMTAHMNGKRHLAKEKRYILGKMRVGVDDGNGDGDYADEDDGKEEDGEGNGADDNDEDGNDDGDQEQAEEDKVEEEWSGEWH